MYLSQNRRKKLLKTNKKVAFPEIYDFFGGVGGAWGGGGRGGVGGRGEGGDTRNFFTACFLRKKLRNFFCENFLELRPKSALGSCILYYSSPYRNILCAMLCIRHPDGRCVLIFSVYDTLLFCSVFI